MLNIAVIMPPLYFKKRRALALGLISSAISLGQILSPLLIRALMANYAYAGAVIIESGIMLHCCVAASLIRPRRRTTPKKEEETSGTFSKYRSDPLFSDLKSNMLQCLACFKNFNIMVYVIADSLSLVGTMNFFMVIPFALHSWGYSFDFAAFALSCMAVTGFVIRILVSYVADKKWFNVTKVYIVASLLQGTLSLCKVKHYFLYEIGTVKFS